NYFPVATTTNDSKPRSAPGGTLSNSTSSKKPASVKVSTSGKSKSVSSGSKKRPTSATRASGTGDMSGKLNRSLSEKRTQRQKLVSTISKKIGEKSSKLGEFIAEFINFQIF